MDIFIKKLKDNLILILIPIIFISFLAINSNVVYFGDDYYYLSFRDLEFTDFFSKLVEHYQKDNGRFIVHLLATLFLKLPMPAWQLFNSFMLTGICYFVAKLTTQGKKENFPLVISIIFFFIASLNILITRQSTYWLTGSFNYIYTSFLFFAYWFCLTKLDNKKYYIPTIIIGFLSAASMEQSGMMTLGVTLLTLLSKIDCLKNIRKILKENIKLIVLSVITLLGVCTVILAPAQFIRIQNEDTGLSTSEVMLENISFLIKNFTANINILPYCLFFNISIIIYIFKNKHTLTKSKNIILMSSILNVLSSIINIFSFMKYNVFTNLNIGLTLVILITYLINFAYINKHLYRKLISPLTISLILMLGSQIMVTITPVFGPRNLIFGMFMFATLICYIINALNLRFKNYFVVIFMILALFNNYKTAQGYLNTKIIENKNLEILENNSALLSDNTNRIALYKFQNDNYGWSMPYHSKYHEYWYKQFYQINSEIYWKE